MRRIYIAGPMTGQPEFNFPAFHAVAARLRQAGAEAINPAESFGGRTDLPRASYIRADMILLAQCQAIIDERATALMAKLAAVREQAHDVDVQPQPGWLSYGPAACGS